MQTTRHDPLLSPHLTSAMDDNILPAAGQSESPQAAKRMRLDTDQEDSTIVPLSSRETEVFVDPHHPSKVLEGLNRLRLNSTLCDVILCCEEQEFPCHRYVLASFSSYFEAMFTSGMRECTQEKVAISGMEPHIIGLMVNYAYTSEMSISTANVQALIAASDLWDVTALHKACCRYMKSHIDMNNCVAIYCFSEDHSCEMLKKHSLDYILEHFSVIYKQKAFLSLSVERLAEILASDHLNVPKEDMVFEAAMLWLGKRPTRTRRQSFEKVLEQIRLPLISPSYLDTVIKSLDVVKDHQGCQRFISEAKERPYSNMARPRRTSVIAVVRKKGGFADKVESFGPLTNRWRTLGYLPFKVDQHVVVGSGSFLYVAGINGGSSMKEMWRFDVHDNSWRKLAPLNFAHNSLNLAVLDGNMFAVGGREEGKSTNPMARYDSTTDTWQLMETWELLAPCRCERNAPIMIALDGWLYFIGGSDPDHKKLNKVQVAKYNPETTVWRKVACMKTPRDDSAACVLNGKIYVIGGWQHKKPRSGGITTSRMMMTMECFNPRTNRWTMCAPTRNWPHEPSVAVMDGNIYVLIKLVGWGRTAGTLELPTGIERYCEETDTWDSVGKIPDRPAGLKCFSLRLRNDYVRSTEMVEDDNDSNVYVEYDNFEHGSDSSNEEDDE